MPSNQKVAGSIPPGNFNFFLSCGYQSSANVKARNSHQHPRGAGSSSAVSGDSDRKFESGLMHVIMA